MELKDFIVTPIVLLIIYFLAYKIRPKVCTVHTKKYFLPALTLKFIGAIALGLIYQFYYGGGDTFGYTTYGSHFIWEAFKDNPFNATRLIFLDNIFRSDLYEYTQFMWYYDDPPAYFIVRLAGILSIITFDTYSSVAILFAIIGFSGLWAFYNALVKIYPELHFKLALAFFAVPSVIFWGSGVMKDTITVSAVAWVSYALFEIFIFKNRTIFTLTILMLSIWIIYIIKIFILFCLIPAAMLWIYILYVGRIKSAVLRYTIQPVLIVIPVAVSIFGLSTLTEGNQRYSFDNILSTAEITAYDNSLWTVRQEGSGYNLGDYDFTPIGLVRKFIPAVWVTLFRPYLWEANSVVMLLSAIESFLLLAFVLAILLNSGLVTFTKKGLLNPHVIMSLFFSITFAFAVGISSGNFGSLVRYKIPIIPFFLIALILIQFHSKRDKKLS
ncbi:hypothetical protein [Fulvivirga lutea]|uniref:Uncharacterized protein n=1 Tax=Fulvivirga lutea TaxID=2810512 RepID=A0A975A1H1_9BACT|nr:hypothetical protein [Fulvivirga lutea]QSE98439.1 hypothetical protein JR347_05010 [Fulvivirga lutea]